MLPSLGKPTAQAARQSVDGPKQQTRFREDSGQGLRGSADLGSQGDEAWASDRQMGSKSSTSTSCHEGQAVWI